MPSEFSFTPPLNNSYVFDNFVTGKANQFAHAAAVQVANSIGITCSPLFIYGGTGVGKTHLIQAIGNQYKSENKQAKIHFVNAANYVSDVVHAYNNDRLDEFNQYYDSLDLLLIDDIERIAGKSITMRELDRTFNSLMDTKKQIVITCDTFTEDLSGIDSRLISRFSCGLSVAIEPPFLEMRVAILLQKAITSKNSIGEDVAYFVAEHVRSDIRKLVGALNRIEAYARFHKRLITVDLAKESIAEFWDEAECML